MQDDCTPTWVTRFFDKVDASGDCWEWTAYISPDGYGRFQIYPTVFNTHRLLYEWMVGPVPEGLVLDHLCRVRHCVNPDHLEAVTQRINLQRGHGAFHNKSSRMKLKSSDVIDMRRRYATGGVTLRALGVEYGVSWKSIHDIVRRKTYKRVV